MSKATLASLLLPIVLSACAGGEPADGTEASRAGDEPSTRREEELQRRLEVRQRAVQKLPERNVQPPQTQVTGEVPDLLLDAVKADLAGRLGVAVDELAVLKGESIVWNDGSLGCPKPGQDYTQVLVPGYWILLTYDNQEFDYRANERGYFLLCELTRTLQPRNQTQ